MLDVTGSNIEFANIVYDKAPMLFGQIEQQGYLKNFDICFSAVGDATCDDYPLQVCDFKYGKDLDEQLKKIYLESGGGGQLKESYEIGTYYFTEHCKMPNAKSPFLFIIGDEAPYPTLRKSIAKSNLGDDLPEDISTKQVLKNALRKYDGNVFFFHNPYCGSEKHNKSETEQIREEWISYFGKKNEANIIPVIEEKSIVDIILGTIALRAGSRDVGTYLVDMKNRGQDDRRIMIVRDSLSDLSKALVPYSDSGIDLKPGKPKKGGGARRI